MSYDEAEQMVAGNLHLTSGYSKVEVFPFYLNQLLIVPVDSDFQIKSDIYREYISNGYDNRDALNSLGLIEKDQEVIIVGTDGKFTSFFSLEKYLEESQYKS